MGEQVGDRYHYSGAIHIHTTESDGTKSLEEVAAIGSQVGLDFMMFADHMGLTNREAGLEGYYNDTVVVIGYEHNDVEDNNHLMVFNSPGVYPEAMTAREYVEAARADNAFTLVAHPIEHRSRDGKYPPYPWLDWSTEAFNGLEIWNQMSEWMEKLTPFNKLVMAFSPRKSMVGPPPEALELWDRLNLKQRYVGVAGVDAHAFPVEVGPLTVEIFPYKVHFRSLRTHIILDEPLSKDYGTARHQLFKALADCRVFVSNIRWGDANKFRFFARRSDQEAVSGQELANHVGVELSVRVPARSSIRLIRNGHAVMDIVSDRLDYTVNSPGLYRVEVWRGRRGWIFSNHIRIGSFRELGF